MESEKFMAQFQGTVKGSKGKATRLSDGFNGLQLRGNGQSIGVHVDMYIDVVTHEEMIKIYLTEGGYGPQKTKRYLGEFTSKNVKV